MSALLKEQNPEILNAQRQQIRLLTGAEVGNCGAHAYQGNGSELFKKICADPRYYLFHEDKNLIKEHAPFIAGQFKNARRLIIIGPGHYLKEAPIIPHLSQLEDVCVVDVSEKFCTNAVKQIREDLDSAGRTNVSVIPMICDFRQVGQYLKRQDNTVAILTGGTVTNVMDIPGQPFPKDQLAITFKDLHGLVKGKGGALAVSYDTNQDEEMVADSYANAFNHAFILNSYGIMSEKAGISCITTKNVSEYFTGGTSIERDVGPDRVLVARHNITTQHPHHVSLNGQTPLKGIFEIAKGTRLCLLNSPKVPEDLVRNVGSQVRFAHKIAISSKSGIKFHIFNPT